jgi:GH35 family endo-1,4-beta-xylanase
MKKKICFNLLLTFLVTTLFGQSWKPAAQDSIIKYRTSPLTIHVTDASDQPVEGVSVHVKLIKHQFKWGSTVDITDVSRIIGNSGTFNTNSKYINHLRLFNSITPNNAGKWKGWIDAPQRAMYLRTIDWLESEGIWNRGHTVVWESERFNAIPDVLLGQTDTAVIRNIVKSHINDIMSRLSDKIYEMDVVNELVHEQHIVNGLLNVPDPALEHSKWYKWAKQAAPNVDLIANEFNLFQSGNNFYQRYIEYVEKMIADGAPVDGVGMQGHFWTEMPTYDELKRRINQVKPLGLPMSVTEFDMRGKAYDDMERVMYAVFSEPQIYGFTIWGAWDGTQWRNNGPIFEDNWEIKPSGHAWLDLVHGKWSNDTVTMTDASGSFTIDAYKGIHKITLMMGDSVFVDTITVGDDVVEATFQKELITSKIPEGTIAVSGDDNEFNVYQPALIVFNSNHPESIEKVEFFEGIFMQFRDTAPDFQYEIINSYAGVRNIYAKVTAKNGYTFYTDTVELTFVNKNAFPNIVNVYPFRNQNFIYGDDVTIAVEASDYENQLWKAELSGYNDTVLADTTVPFQFVLPAPEPGLYQLEIKVLDSLYGFNTQKITFSVLAPDQQNVSFSTPLKASDDVEELSDGSIETEGDLDLGEKESGIRFSNASLPAEASIDSAFIQFTTDNVSLGEISWDIFAELSSSAEEFSTSSNDLSKRTNLSSGIYWNPVEWQTAGERTFAQRTPDLKMLFEELVTINGWTEQSPVVIIMGTGTEENKRRAVSYDISPQNAPELQLYYTVELDLTAPEAPENLHLSERTDEEITIRWNAPDDPDVLGYFVYVDGEKLDPYGTNNTRYTMNIPSETENVYVTAINTYSIESAPSNTISTDDEVSVGTSFSALKNNVSIYPNPFTNRVTIQIEDAPVDVITIFNHIGQVVATLTGISRDGTSIFTWDGADASGNQVAPGIYMAKISVENQSEVIKIIKHP